MIFGNSPWAPSGYGTQAAQLGRTLKRNGHDVGFASYWGLQGAGVSWEGMPVYPGSGEDAYARDVLPGHYHHFGADLLITLMDIWVLDPAQLQGMNIAHWMPVDCSPLSAMDRKTLAGPGRPVAMSRFGHRQLLDAGYENALYVPHALDMETWSPLEDRDAARAQLGFTGKFVAGINAANQDPDRKGFWEQLKAFSVLASRHGDVRMIIHTRVNTTQGSDIVAMIASLGLSDIAVPGDQYAVAAGLIGDSQMVSWHGVMDVLSNTAWGEGFGLPVLQSQACGTPVVVTGWSAMTELCGSGWKVAGQEKWARGHNARWMVPSIPGIARAYEQAYQKAREPRMRQKARRFALAYDAQRVYEKFWVPALEQLTAAPPSRRRRTAAGRKIFAPVMLRNELDMLAMRLAECDGLVDHHVICESEVTHRGVAKPLCWPRAGKRFARYAPQVHYQVVPLPDAQDPWVREHAQRDGAWPWIDEHAADDDWVLIGDVDEIPSRSLLERLRAGQVPGDAAAVRMRVFIHHARYEVPQDRVPPQCVVATAGYIRAHGGSLAAVRDKRDAYPVLEDGGMHFSWFGGPEAARDKLETATCHTELLSNGEGPLIADGTRYYTTEDGGGLPVARAEIDGSFPAMIRDGKCPESWLGPAMLAEATA